MHPTVRQKLPWLALAAATLLALPGSADPLPGSAAAMDLGNREARWVAVRFEVSPEDRPGQIRSRYTTRFLARFEPAELEGAIRVTVAATIVEKHLFTGQEPSPGSFSDFVWTFDAETGHVLSATTSGVLLREIGWGFARWKTDAAIDVHMDTYAPVGFESSRLMGKAYPRLCAKPDRSHCTVVEPTRYDAASGYVNAVGRVTARSSGLRIHSFSPLGEAVFTEIDDPFDAIWTQGDAALRADVAAPPSQALGDGR